MNECCFGASARSGHFYVPRWQMFGRPVLVIEEGVPKYSMVTSSEKLVCSDANKKILWDASEEAIGEKFEV